MKRVKCIIVDDEPVARKIIREFVNRVPYLELLGEFETAIKDDFFSKAQPNRPENLYWLFKCLY
jgi:hypothetical protein